MSIFNILTVTGTSKYPYPMFKKVDSLWTSGNQVSTYELLVRLLDNNRHLIHIYQLVKSDPDKYGRYAGNNHWSPVFTDYQLQQFSSLIGKYYN